MLKFLLPSMSVSVILGLHETQSKPNLWIIAHLYDNRSHRRLCCCSHTCRRHNPLYTDQRFDMVWWRSNTGLYSYAVCLVLHPLSPQGQKAHHSFVTHEGSPGMASVFGWLRLVVQGIILVVVVFTQSLLGSRIQYTYLLTHNTL